MTPGLRALRDRAMAPSTSSLFVLAGAMLLAFLVRVVLGARLEAPVLLCDEFIYAELAQSFAEEGRFLLREEPTYQSLLYPILLAPSWFASSMETTYELAKATNALLLTAAAVPVYVWASRLVSPGWALLPAALTLLMPAQLFSGLLLTEAAFLPAFILATYAIARAIELPSPQRQVVALVAIGLACAVRVQGIVLLPVLATAVLSYDLIAIRGTAEDRLSLLANRLRQWWLTAAALAVGALIYAVAQLARGASLSGGLGSYEDVITGDYSFEAGWQFSRLHLAALALSVGLAPISALIVLTTRAIFEPSRVSARQRAFLVVAAASSLWIVVEAGLFASRFGGSVAERYVCHVAPLLFLALAVWLAEGLPRPLVATALGAAFPASLLLVEPLSRYLGTDMLISSFTLFAFFKASDDVGGVDNLVWVWRLGSIAAAVAFAVLWRPLVRILIPAALVVFFVLAQRPGDGELVAQSTRVRFAPGVGENASWVDDRVGRDTRVDFLYTPTADGVFASSTIMLQVKFWNRSVVSVVNVGTREACALTERGASIDPATGRITVAGPPLSYVVAERGVDLAGTRLGEKEQLVLHEIAPPASLASTSEGVYRDGWTGAEASLTQYRTPGGRPGRARVAVSRTAWTGPDVPGKVTLEVGPLEGANLATLSDRRTLVIHSAQSRSVSLRTPPPPFRIRIRVDPTFSPAEFGLPDTRQLGVQLSYEFVP